MFTGAPLNNGAQVRWFLVVHVILLLFTTWLFISKGFSTAVDTVIVVYFVLSINFNSSMVFFFWKVFMDASLFSFTFPIVDSMKYLREFKRWSVGYHYMEHMLFSMKLKLMCVHYFDNFIKIDGFKQKFN